MSSNTSARRRANVSRLIALPLIATIGYSCGSDEAAYQLVGQRPSAAQQVDAIPIPDASNEGAPFEFRAQADHLLIVYFGYTSCPDVCPTTLAAVRSALKDIGDDASRIDVAMATIDPARDTDEVIAGYVQSFVPAAHGLRTTDDTELRKITEQFGMNFGVATNAAGEVEVTHSGNLYVVDETGKVLLTWPFGVTSDHIATDLDVLFEEIDS